MEATTPASVRPAGSDVPRGQLVADISGLSKAYRGNEIVRDLTLRVHRGAVTGFIGPNGAGKTTTLRMMLGLVAPDAGTGTILGDPLTSPERYLARVGAMIEAPAFYPALSGRTNLMLLADLSGHGARAVDRALETAGLTSRARDRARDYSLGMKQRLGIAGALLGDPDLLILDEPTNGLDPAGIRDVRAIIRRIADGGAAVLVSSHLLGELETVADEVILISNGQARFSGSLSSLLSRQRPTIRITATSPNAINRLAGLYSEIAEVLSTTDHEIVVAGPAELGADLNRIAMSNDIVLGTIVPCAASLEDAFFALESDHKPTS